MIRIDLHKKLDGADGAMALHINTELETGSFVTLYGPSGAGKTSTLRMLAGLMEPDAGEILLDQHVWYHSKKKIDRPPQKRDLGYVFQDYALFPHLTVRENLLFALQNKKNHKVVDELIELTELGDLQNRKPNTLSGGQQQRVAVARSLVRKPKLLLLDEPLAALDYKIRIKMQDYLLELHREFKLTTILVSHDIGEISKLSNQVIQLENGQIVRMGSPSEIFVGQQISGKFKFVGEILEIEAQDIVYVVSVLIQNQVIKVIAQKEELQGLSVGSKILIASKAFNPIIQKID